MAAQALVSSSSSVESATQIFGPRPLLSPPTNLSFPVKQGASRQLWFASKQSLSYLDGSLRLGSRRFTRIYASLDLTEDNVKLVLDDAREKKFSHLFDTSIGMTGDLTFDFGGVVELAEVDGPFVKIRLKGRFWHERSLVLARLGNYLKERIPEILEVDIEDEKQLDDSPENF